jgi:hypothetical protein
MVKKKKKKLVLGKGENIIFQVPGFSTSHKTYKELGSIVHSKEQK